MTLTIISTVLIILLEYVYKTYYTLWLLLVYYKRLLKVYKV